MLAYSIGAFFNLFFAIMISFWLEIRQVYFWVICNGIECKSSA